MSAISPNRKCMLEEHSAAGGGGSRFSRIKGIFLRLQKMHSCAHSLCTVILAEECYRNNLISLKGWNLPFYSSTNAKRILQICFQFSIQILSTEVCNRNFVRLAIFPSLGAAPRALHMPYICPIRALYSGAQWAATDLASTDAPCYFVFSISFPFCCCLLLK